ncbi:hypothetical protein BDV28DRAFT_149400 [Aspergillus coremiiformis]|uniref:Uncharacterized protein n=1 Tax=Aspergillus coremiiformis TaxID=138285 RepID=A0A5N6Z5T8_9EURO|nr:hypothetical protein BDV28DRAFT_149400 [Aspergillus coremiiformis]
MNDSTTNLSNITDSSTNSAAKEEQNVSTPTLTSLTDHVDKMSFEALDGAIATMSDLVPGLVVSISSNGERLIAHDDYEGTAELDQLGEMYLDCAKRCPEAQLALEARLLHVSLADSISSLYKVSDWTLEEGLRSGEVTAHPDGSGYKTSTHSRVLKEVGRESALLFKPDDYKALWPGESPTSMCDICENGVQYSLWKASKQQVEEAIACQKT